MIPARNWFLSWMGVFRTADTPTYSSMLVSDTICALVTFFVERAIAVSVTTLSSLKCGFFFVSSESQVRSVRCELWILALIGEIFRWNLKIKIGGGARIFRYATLVLRFPMT